MSIQERRKKCMRKRLIRTLCVTNHRFRRHVFPNHFARCKFIAQHQRFFFVIYSFPWSFFKVHFSRGEHKRNAMLYPYFYHQFLHDWSLISQAIVWFGLFFPYYYHSYSIITLHEKKIDNFNIQVENWGFEVENFSLETKFAYLFNSFQNMPNFLPVALNQSCLHISWLIHLNRCTVVMQANWLECQYNKIYRFLMSSQTRIVRQLIWKFRIFVERREIRRLRCKIIRKVFKFIFNISKINFTYYIYLPIRLDK